LLELYRERSSDEDKLEHGEGQREDAREWEGCRLASEREKREGSGGAAVD
jgi:hypothetical protein